MNYTQNYQLNQWVESDRVLMEDFNADNQKIEAALVGKCEVITGTYNGNGSDNRFINLGRTPVVVILCDDDSNMRDGSYTYGGIVTPELETLGLFITENGFIVRENGNVHCNFISNGYPRVYRYIALFN